MHINVAAGIREVLDNMQAVSISPLGTLQLKHIPAHFSDKGRSLSPPKMVLDHNDQITSNKPLISRLVKNYGITKESAQKVVNAFNKKLLNNLVNYKKVSIENVMTITRSDKGKVKVAPYSGFVDTYYNGLPKVGVEPILKTKKKDIRQAPAAAPIVPKKSIPTQSESTPKTNIASNGVNKEAKVASQAVPPTPSSTLKSSFVAPVNKKSEVKPIAASTETPMTHTAAVYKEAKPSILRPLLLIAALLLLLALCYKGCTSFLFKGNGKASSKIDQANITNTNLDDIAPADSISAEALEEMRKDKSLIPASGECKIITGVYSRYINVERMRDKLYNAGYTVYTEPLGSYTRVGLIYDCNQETDLEAYLQEVRRTISKKAWYLDPSLYVDYIY